MNWWDDDSSEFNALPPRVAKRLKGAGLNSIEEVAAAGEDAIRGIGGIGRYSLAEIKNWLRAAHAAGKIGGQPERTQERKRGADTV